MNTKILSTILFVCFVFCSFGQSVEAPTSGIINSKYKKTVDSYLNFSIPVTTVDILKSLDRPHVILDARERKEYDVSHIPGALYFGYKNPEYNILETIGKNETIIIYCSIGYRSEKLGKKLKDRGYNNVINLYGSIFEWANKNYPLYNNQNQEVKRVHGYNKKWSKWVDNKNLEVIF